jgi:D-beta-D-heptose 7-phosphate kinase/D-beta-D-heptose 1-phosphate adenosyltransferase
VKTPTPVSRKQLVKNLRKLRIQKKKIVFTNGVFDILHRGHVDYLRKAKALGDILVVGMNTDNSVRKIKGPHRPIQNQNDRAVIVGSLKAVDYVILFNEPTPDRLIHFVKPDVLVKGADYKLRQIAGTGFVKSYGGKVKRIKLTPGRSTSKILTRL